MGIWNILEQVYWDSGWELGDKTQRIGKIKGISILMIAMLLIYLQLSKQALLKVRPYHTLHDTMKLVYICALDLHVL